MEEKKFLTAKEARELAESSQCLKNRVYKAIREEAKECRTMLTWEVRGSSQLIINNLITSLRNDGYIVSRSEPTEGISDTIAISWE